VGECLDASGIGLTQKQAVKLFQPFTQGDTYTNRRFGGSGLGLALSRQLARLLGGNIVLLKSEIEKGSVFEITLPLEIVKQNNVVENTLQKTRMERPLEGISILLAEDVKEIQLLMTKYLSAAGAVVELADDGHEAIKKSLMNLHDIVLMDLQMPNLNGYEATSKLRERSFEKPIIALTASSLKEDMLLALSSGCNDYIAKPANIDMLVAMIQRLTNKNHSAATTH